MMCRHSVTGCMPWCVLNFGKFPAHHLSPMGRPITEHFGDFIYCFSPIASHSRNALWRLETLQSWWLTVAVATRHFQYLLQCPYKATLHTHQHTHLYAYIYTHLIHSGLSLGLLEVCGCGVEGSDCCLCPLETVCLEHFPSFNRFVSERKFVVDVH